MAEVLSASLWSHWSLPDWFSVVGFPLAVVGLAVTAIGVWRTKSATTAVSSAIVAIRRQLVDDHVLLRIQTLLQAEQNLRHAIDENDQATCQRQLDEWRQAANDINTLIRNRPERQELRLRLVEAMPFVLAARDSLADRNRNARDATLQVSERLRLATEKANEILVERITLAEG